MSQPRAAFNQPRTLQSTKVLRVPLHQQGPRTGQTHNRVITFQGIPSPAGKEKRACFLSQSLLAAAPHLSSQWSELLVTGACWAQVTRIYAEPSSWALGREERPGLVPGNVSPGRGPCSLQGRTSWTPGVFWIPGPIPGCATPRKQGSRLLPGSPDLGAGEVLPSGLGGRGEEGAQPLLVAPRCWEVHD